MYSSHAPHVFTAVVPAVVAAQNERESVLTTAVIYEQRENGNDTAVHHL